MIEHIRNNPYNALWVDMGLGKTVSTLTAIQAMLDDFDIHKSLVVAPLRVARKTWTDEIETWSHLNGLTTSKILGTPKQRLDGITREADIYLINRENLAWLVHQHVERRNKRWYLSQKWRWDNVILDESSSFKSRESQRWKMLRLMRKYIERMTQLTGTPSPNGLIDLWAQLNLLDQGQRLGTGIQAFRKRWFDPPGYLQGKWTIKPGAEQQIYDELRDIVLTLRAEDYLDLPPVINNYIPVELSRAEQKQYNDFARNYILDIAGERITAANAGVLAGKLLQCANGAVYTEHPAWEAFHGKKLEALSDIVDTTEGPRLIFYSFQSDLARIEALFKKQKVPYRVLQSEQDEVDWDNGEIENLILHPASAGHGLNMHKSGSELIIWFGLQWSLELYQQANARLIGGHRRIGKNVVTHHIYTQNTYDENVILSLSDKEKTQDDLLEATKVLVRQALA